MKKLLTLLLATSLLTGCNSAPLFNEEEGEEKFEAYMELMKTDPEAAYEQSSELFKENSSLELFTGYSKYSAIQDLQDITIIELSSETSRYSQKNDGPHASIVMVGEAHYEELTKNISSEWTYNFAEERWELGMFDLQ